MIPFLAPAAPLLTSVWGFMKRIPDWVLWVIAAVVFLKFIDMRAEQRGRQQQRQGDTIKTIDTVRKIEKEATTDANRAIAAGDSLPPVTEPDELPDDIAAVIFRGHQASGPDR